MTQLDLIPRKALILKQANSSEIGQERELRVRAELIARGFEIFPNDVSVGPVDLMGRARIDAHELTLKIQVKSPTTQRDVDWDHTDLLAVVGTDNKITYFEYDPERGARKKCDPVVFVLGWAKVLKEHKTSTNVMAKAFREYISILERQIEMLKELLAAQDCILADNDQERDKYMSDYRIWQVKNYISKKYGKHISPEVASLMAEQIVKDGAWGSTA